MSRMWPDHPHRATPTEVVMTYGDPKVVNSAGFLSKLVQGFWLLERSKICLFLCLALRFIYS